MSSTFAFDTVRFTFLTPRLIRCEMDPMGHFMDGQTQTVLHRHFSDPEVARREGQGTLELKSEGLTLRYRHDASGFTPNSLRIEANDGSFSWSFGTPNPEDLPGTLRTLDNANGLVNMMTGERHALRGSVISRKGWTVLDDSKTLVFNERGFLSPREGSSTDIYFFGYGQDYDACLRDYFRLTGPPPLPPKFVLGLWWSKWWPYRDQELLGIIDEFETHGVPLSICVVDMDWHIVFNPHHTGWTGYTWNPHYFPDPDAFFRVLKEKGVHTCLNLHPHEGIAPHEEAYPRMARRLGMDPAKGERIPFDLANETFLQAYFEELHSPLEEQGVDFWWMDWQQGETCSLPGVDPLWYLNHLHATQLARNGKKRPLIFSRWGDHASHRYPVGFSGDTYATWETLSILPYFTAASANLGYGWRSDETGGFQRGDHRDHELFTRWNQFAALSPTYRLHNCGDPTLDHRPWSKPADIRDTLLAAMRLRRELLPYLYTAAHQHALGGPCLCRPLYHAYPDAEEAYLVPRQYLLGPDLIAAPHTRPADPDTGLARQVVWLPEGTWYDFFTGTAYEGGRFHAVYGDLDHIPLFARAGSVIPLQIEDRSVLRVFPGDGVSFLYDDDGHSQDWTQGAYSLRRIEQTHRDGISRLSAEQISGDLAPAEDLQLQHPLTRDLHPAAEPLEIRCPPRRFPKEDVIACLQSFRMLAHTTRPLIGKPGIDFDGTRNEPYTKLDDILADPTLLRPYLADFTPSQIRCLLEQITDSGFHAEALPDQAAALCYWSPSTGPHAPEVSVSHRLDYSYADAHWTADTPHAFLRIPTQSAFVTWQATVQYPGLWSYTESRSGAYKPERQTSFR